MLVMHNGQIRYKPNCGRHVVREKYTDRCTSSVVHDVANVLKPTEKRTRGYGCKRNYAAKL